MQDQMKSNQTADKYPKDPCPCSLPGLCTNMKVKGLQCAVKQKSAVLGRFLGFIESHAIDKCTWRIAW